MKRGVIIGIVIAVLAILILGYFVLNSGAKQKISGGENLINNPGSQQNETNPALTIVYIKNFNFDPTSVNIFSGETITWENEDAASHKIVSDSGTEINSDSLSTGQRYAHTFNTPGTYEYHCSIHPSMKGKVVVAGK